MARDLILLLQSYYYNCYNNYCRICDEREQRVDIEEIIADERTARDAFVKDLEAGKKRAKIVVDLVEEAHEELEAFQVYSGFCPPPNLKSKSGATSPFFGLGFLPLRVYIISVVVLPHFTVQVFLILGFSLKM